MTKRADELQAELDAAKERIAVLENKPAAVIHVYAEAAEPPRNSLQSLGDWWRGGKPGSNGATRHMRMNY